MHTLLICGVCMASGCKQGCNLHNTHQACLAVISVLRVCPLCCCWGCPLQAWHAYGCFCLRTGSHPKAHTALREALALDQDHTGTTTGSEGCMADAGNQQACNPHPPTAQPAAALAIGSPHTSLCDASARTKLLQLHAPACADTPHQCHLPLYTLPLQVLHWRCCT